MKLINFKITMIFFSVIIFANNSWSNDYKFKLGKPVSLNNEVYLDVNYITHAGGFSEKYKMPIWIEYNLNSNKLKTIKNNKIKRSAASFKIDPLININKQIHPNDYKLMDNIDRGHLAPYFIVGTTVEEKKAVNYMSNIAPQNQGLNRGCWRIHEKKIMERVLIEKENLLITVGIIVKDKDEQNNIKIPTHFYMIIHSIDINKTNVVFFPNKERDKKTCSDISYLNTTENQLEKLVNLNFYPNKK